MRKGEKKLLIFEITIMLLLFLSNFVSSILNNYFKIAILIFLLASFRLLFGFEKNKERYSKRICIELIIYLLIYFILYYLFGIIIGFTRPINYMNFNGLIKVIIPLIIEIILEELLRYMMLRKSDGSKLLLVITCIFFIVFDLIGTMDTSSLNSNYSAFVYIAIILLPAISKNIFCSYLSYKCGYKPVWLYLLVLSIYPYILPIIPNPNEYIYSIIELVIPMIFLYRIYVFFKRESDESISREYNKKKIGIIAISLLIVALLVYFTSGFFYYHAIAIATGSMYPNIKMGDVVVIEKIPNKKDIKIGQVIAYKHDNLIVIHRVVKKINVSNEVYFYTKGDANNDIDNYKIPIDSVIGVANVKVPYIGYPTIWIKELD